MYTRWDVRNFTCKVYGPSALSGNLYVTISAYESNSHCSIGLPVLRQLVIPSSLTIGGQEAQDLVAFKDFCAEETIEPQVSRVENNLIICYCSEICFVFLLACTGQLESKPLGRGVYRFVLL